MAILDHHLRSIVDEVYGEAEGGDSIGVLGPLFAVLRSELSTWSGTFRRLDPSDCTITVPYWQNMGALESLV